MIKVNFSRQSKINFQRLTLSGVLWLVVSSASLLFLPQSFLSLLGLDQFVSRFNHFIGLAMLIGIAYFIARLLNILLDEIISYLTNKRLIENIEDKVALLDLTERALLREFFLQGTTVLTLPQHEAPVKSLLEAGILECLGNEKRYTTHGSTANYKISQKARHYLNCQVLRLPTGQPTPDEWQALINTRPPFASNVVPPKKYAA